jgi:hypothetical protein
MVPLRLRVVRDRFRELDTAAGTLEVESQVNATIVRSTGVTYSLERITIFGLRRGMTIRRLHPAEELRVTTVGVSWWPPGFRYRVTGQGIDWRIERPRSRHATIRTSDGATLLELRPRDGLFIASDQDLRTYALLLVCAEGGLVDGTSYLYWATI